MKNINVSVIRGLEFLGIFILLLLGPAVSAYVMGKSFRMIFFGVMLCASFSMILVYVWYYEQERNKTDTRFSWFVMAFLYGLLTTCLFPFLPVDGWFVLPLALAFAICADLPVGVLSYTGLLGICVYLSDASVISFLLYLFCGLFVEVIFHTIDEEVKIGIPFLLSMLVYVICMAGKNIYFTEGALIFDQLLVPCINFFISAILMLAVLRIYCAKVVDKEKELYIDINDQEFFLLAKYKEEDPDIYYNAIHTDYFVEKIARARNMDLDLAKNGSYYHKVIAAECNKEGMSLEELCEKYHFPDKAITLLQEYTYKSKPISMKETAIVYLTDAVVSSIMYLVSKEDTKEVDYGKIALAIINRKKESGILNDSDLSLKDIQELEKIFEGEKLYYDFLRRK